MPAFQAMAKFSQIQQNPAKRGQRQSKKKACICLDSLVRNEPFQWVALTPGPFFLSWPLRDCDPATFVGVIERRVSRSGIMASEILSRLLMFRKKLLQNFRPRELAGSVGGAVTRPPFAGRFEPPGAGVKL
jgi:hypothetical protein